MAIFNSYVKLPEGICWVYAGFMVILCWVRWIEKCHRYFLSKRRSFVKGRSRVWHWACQWSVCSFNIPLMLHVWYIYPQNSVIFRANAGIHIPAPWFGYGYQIWLIARKSEATWRRLSNAANFWGLDTGTWHGDLKWGLEMGWMLFCHSIILPFLSCLTCSDGQIQRSHASNSHMGRAAVVQKQLCRLE